MSFCCFSCEFAWYLHTRELEMERCSPTLITSGNARNITLIDDLISRHFLGKLILQTAHLILLTVRSTMDISKHSLSLDWYLPYIHHIRNLKCSGALKSFNSEWTFHWREEKKKRFQTILGTRRLPPPFAIGKAVWCTEQYITVLLGDV